MNLLAIDPIHLWIYALVIVGLIGGIATGFFKARKIQPKGFKWKIFRNEIIFATINLTLSVVLLGWPSTWLKNHGYIHYQHGSAPYWVYVLEYAAYFFGFDTWFYWLHRWMHTEP
ncbi:MAG: fatty acid hydroxylase, partial [Alphaproteobacteria bacterium]|nr:fatty acid hydroxylase [Alphaproteobacteria bacterium]